MEVDEVQELSKDAQRLIREITEVIIKADRAAEEGLDHPTAYASDEDLLDEIEKVIGKWAWEKRAAEKEREKKQKKLDDIEDAKKLLESEGYVINKEKKRNCWNQYIRSKGDNDGN